VEDQNPCRVAMEEEGKRRRIRRRMRKKKTKM
jgi:hypothetical protein